MPWRLVGFILIFFVFIAFILSNLRNESDISFFTWTLPNIPVFVTVFASFLVGMLASVPIIISINLKKRKQGDKPLKPKKGKKAVSSDSDEALDVYEVN